MTPSELAEYARRQYNAVGDAFFSDPELYQYIWAAQLELATEALCIRRVYTASTVAAQQEYEYPTNALSIKRVTYDGEKLTPITFREEDALTSPAVTVSGSPQYYAVWNDTLYLTPIPDAVGTLKIFSINEPQEVDNTSVLEVPTRYHLKMADFLLAAMCAKEKNFQAAGHYQARWDKTVMDAKKQERKYLRGDAFLGVNDSESMASNVLGSS